MKYVVLACVILYIAINVVLAILTRINKKKNEEFKIKINKRFDDMLSSLARTESIINEERHRYQDYPEHLRNQLLSGYDEIEEKIKETRNRIYVIHNSL